MKRYFQIWSILLFSGIILLPFNLLAQNAKIDSLLTVLSHSKEDTNKVNILNDIGRELINTGDYDSAIKYTNDAKTLAEKIEFKKGIAKALNNIGVVYHHQGNYPEALKNYLQSLKIREETRDQGGVIDSYNNIGLIYINQSNYPEALKNLWVALKISESDPRYSEGIGNKKGIADIYMNIGVIYALQKNYSEALKIYFQALKISEEIGYNQVIARCYNNIGNIYYFQGNYNSALKNLLKALKIKEETGTKGDIIVSQITIGSVYIKQEKYNDAKKYLVNALQESKEIGAKDYLKECYSSLAELSEATGDYKNAYQYHKLYSEIKDSLLNESNSKQIAEMKTKYETEKKEKEITTLTIANELQVQKTKRRNSYIIAIASLSLLILSGLWFQSYRRKKKLIISEKEIEKKNLELKNKDLAIEKEKVEERAKVQKEIAEQYHDILGSKITGLLFMCENVKAESRIQGNENGFADKVSLKVRDIAETNRSGIIALDPDTEQLDSFIAKLRSDLYDMVETAGKLISFITPQLIPKTKIQPIIKFNLSAVMKEAINNSIKYSNTNDVIVQIELIDTRYVINIIDNGVGINPEKKKGHSYGLSNMIHRMESIGGTCQVISKLNEGTTVRLEGNFVFTSSERSHIIV